MVLFSVFSPSMWKSKKEGGSNERGKEKNKKVGKGLSGRLFNVSRIFILRQEFHLSLLKTQGEISPSTLAFFRCHHSCL